MAGSSISQGAESRGAGGSPLWLRVGFWACTVIGVAAVIRRALVLWFPPKSNAVQAELDHAFQSHAGLTFAHILPAVPAKVKRAPKPDILARLRANFGDLVISDETYDEVMRQAGASHVDPVS